MQRAFSYLLLILMLGACATRNDQYYWGEYEELVHGSLESKAGAEPEAQVQKLTSLIHESESVGKKVPPGLYAHLGYMKHLTGNDPGAVEALEHEKRLYPSSTVFVDRLLASLKGKKSGKQTARK